MKEKQLKTLGVWLGFDFPLSIKREGVGRFVFYLVKSLLKNYPIQCEIWCYSFNDTEVREMFSTLEQDDIYHGRIKLITENDFQIVKTSRWVVSKSAINDIVGILRGKEIGWKQPYYTYSKFYSMQINDRKKCRGSFSYIHSLLLLPFDVLLSALFVAGGFLAKGLKKTILKHADLTSRDTKEDLLASYANKKSQADCFLIPIITLYNALDLKKPKLCAVHDLAPLEYSQNFSAEKPGHESWIREYRQKINALAKQGTFLCSNSDYVRMNHTLKYIDGIQKENTDFVYLPANIPDDIHNKILKQSAIMSKYHLETAYIFYPTQIRPYKNVLILVKALKILSDKGVKLQLVLTGYIKDAPNIKMYIREYNLDASVLFTGDVPEVDLYSLHKYAEATVVPTLFEGGFPWQGLEALLMDTPVVMSKIPVTLERLRYEGLDPESCGLKLFDPTNEKELADKISDVLRDRQKSVEEQQIVRAKLFSYTWDDATLRYYEIFTKKVLPLS